MVWLSLPLDCEHFKDRRSVFFHCVPHAKNSARTSAQYMCTEWDNYTETAAEGRGGIIMTEALT